MQKLLFVVVAVLALGACAPSAHTVTPLESEEQVSPFPFAEAFAVTVNAINSQPFPSDSGGWVITSSDQVGGFISAELNGRRYQLFSGQVSYRAFVSIALVDKGDGTTAVNLSLNTHNEASKLVAALRARLQLDG